MAGEGTADAPRQGMLAIKQAATEFLASKRIAVTGVSRKPQGHSANVIYERLLDRGYEVFAVNPNAKEIDGRPCYPDLASIPFGVDAVVIATRPEHADATVQECAKLGIKQIWMHRAFGAGSVSPAAATFAREHGLTVIDGGCPLMFEPTADFGHKVFRVICKWNGHLPQQV